MLATNQQLKQVVGYVQESVKEELGEIRGWNSRISESQLVADALAIAMPQLRQRYSSFKVPVHGASGRRKVTT